MRVANVIEEGRVGGPQVRMVRVAEGLASRVNTIVVMPQANSVRFRELCEASSVKCHALALTRITKEWRAALRFCVCSPYEIIAMSRLFRRERVDVVHASGGSWQYKAVIGAKLARRPVIWHLNDTQMPAWVRCLFRLVQPLADGFIFASHRSEEYYGSEIGNRPRMVIPAAVDCSNYSPAFGRKMKTPDWIEGSDSKTIGTIANVNPIKGIETLITALSVLHGQERNVRLIIVGAVFENQEAYHRRLLSLARALGVADHIIWVGSESDVRRWLSWLDVYVCSSHAESSPMSVWEAMAMARPLVATDVGDVPRHVVDGDNGFIVPVGDSEAMAARIGTLLDDEGLQRRFGERAREVAVQNFSVEKVAEATGDFYEEVLAYWRGRGNNTGRRTIRGANG